MFRDVVGIALLIGVLVVAPLGANSPYFLITPGGTFEVGSQAREGVPARLSIPDDYRRPMGRMAFTAVFEQPASWAEVLHAQLFGRAEIVPANLIRPPGTTQEQVNATNQRLIDESKPIAAVVGLRAAGFPVEITGHGARVQSVAPGLPADGVLQPGDVIVTIDDQPITTADSLIQVMTSHKIGDDVTVGVVRDGANQNVVLKLGAAPGGVTRPVLGVTVSTYQFGVNTPFQVDIQSDNVGGPSAGLMFALAILDGVTDGDLTRGYYVAGTGTIAQDGTVGAVGGAAEKALAAEQDGAQVFLVPRDDAAGAGRWVRNIQIVPVGTFDEAVQALCALTPRENAASPDVPTPCASG